MDLTYAVLDAEVRDRNGREMGRVDGVVIELRDDGPPRVVGIEVGPAVLAHRIHPLLGRCVAGLELALGIADGRPLRIPFSDILTIGNHITVDRAVGETTAATVERALRSVMKSIPGA
jgi:sporulation protein YlmC with PRC-barrel domain